MCSVQIIHTQAERECHQMIVVSVSYATCGPYLRKERVAGLCRGALLLSYENNTIG